MANYKKKVRDTLITVVSHASNGFNAQLAAIAASYGITPFTIDWTLASDTFVIGFVEPEVVEKSTVVKFPCAVLYTGRAVDSTKSPGSKFHGQVLAAIDIYLRYRALMDRQHAGNVFANGADTESIADAVEDAMNESLYLGRTTFQINGITPSDYGTDRDPLTLVDNGDGHSQRLKFTLGFDLRV